MAHMVQKTVDSPENSNLSQTKAEAWELLEVLLVRSSRAQYYPQPYTPHLKIKPKQASHNR